MCKLTDKQEQIEVLGIIAHNLLGSKDKKYILKPICQWTENICKELNNTFFAKNIDFEFDSEDTNLLVTNNENLRTIFDSIKQIVEVEKIYCYESLPDEIKYVHFSKTVILKSENDAKECLDSIEKGLGFLNSFDGIKKALLEKMDPISSYVDDELRKIEKICALNAKFSSGTRSMIGTDNYIWNELLQNANDHIPDNSDKTLTVTIKKSSLNLSYPDAGFSIRDFLAICTNGNSGNVISKDDREGHKGTGFKSVYKVFDKVVIKSNLVECTLDDSKNRDFKIEDNDIIFVKDRQRNDNNSGESGGKSYFPVPKFEKLNEEDKIKGTEIELFFTNSDNEKFLKAIFPEKDSDFGYKEKFISGNVYLFLSKISKFCFEFWDCSDNNFTFDRVKYISNTFYQYKQQFNIGDELHSRNPIWFPKDEIIMEKLKRKSRLELLFPKTPNEFDETEKPVYCTLPIKEFQLKTPFYINIPLLELEDGRNSLARSQIEKEGQSFNLEEWNSGIVKCALSGENSAFSIIIKKISEVVSAPSNQEENEITIDNLYKYIPYAYLDETMKVMRTTWESLRIIPFIRTVAWIDNEYKITPMSINQWYNREHTGEEIPKIPTGFVILPKYMYWWFSKNSERVYDFENQIPYLYYDDMRSIYDHENMYNSNTLISKITCINSNYGDHMLSLYRENEKKVGKLLLIIRDYLDELSKKNNVKENFTKLLKKIFNSDEFNFSVKKKMIFKWYLGEANYNMKVHCVGNEELKNKTEKEMLCIGDFKDISEYSNDIRETFYDKDGTLQLDDKRAIKDCFSNIIESPYIIYETKRENGEAEELGTVIDLNSNRVHCEFIEAFKRTNFDNNEFKIKYGQELEKFIYSEKLKIEVLIDKEYLFCKNKKNNIIPFKKGGFYFSTKNIDDDSIISEPTWLKETEYVKNLDTEILKEEFFENASIKLIESIIDEYGLHYEYNSFTLYAAIINWLERWEKGKADDDTDNKAKILFTTLFGQYLLKWDKKFLAFLNEIQLESDKKGIFEFQKNEITAVSKDKIDRFDARISYEKANQKNINVFLNEELSLKEILKNRVYIYPEKAGRRSLYLYSIIKEKDDEEGKKIIVLFGEESLGKMLRELFDCNEYSEAREFEDMDCLPLDELKGWENENAMDWMTDKKFQEVCDKFFRTKANLWTGKGISKNEYAGNQNWLIDELISRCDIIGIYNEKKVILRTKGYGDKHSKDKKCPICGGLLLAEKSLLKIGYVSIKDQEKNIHLPILMCINCYKAMAFADRIFILDENDNEIMMENDNLKEILDINTPKDKKIKICFDLYIHESKTVLVNMTFYIRRLWDAIINCNNL